jgi:hypothetical protein
LMMVLHETLQYLLAVKTVSISSMAHPSISERFMLNIIVGL